jgi:DNA repair protein RecN (Recombination protein N)
MLTHIHIRHFAIIDELDLDIYPGMTVMTGETGAGKSIMIDALSLCMGERADASFVRTGYERAEISVTLDIHTLPAVQAWLAEHELNQGEECVIRRTVLSDGRSRAYINGTSVPLSTLKSLARLMIDIHSQHAHHALFKTETHRHLLDVFGKHGSLVQTVADAYHDLRALKEKHATLVLSESQKADEMDLLRFQINELEALCIKPNEWETLTAQHDMLSKSGELIATIQDVLNLLSENPLSQAKSSCEKLIKLDPSLEPIYTMLEEARINSVEAANSLNAYAHKMDTNPAHLEAANQRLTVLHEMARKHRVQPEALLDKLASLQERMNALESQTAEIEQLAQTIIEKEKEYQTLCADLTSKRAKIAPAINQAVTDSMQQLGMPGGVFTVHFEPLETPSAHGAEQVVFMVSTNPGAAPAPIHKIASGGELSRISLALQVLIVQDDSLPVIVFDEVDVGIGGGTAEIVGQLLNALGKKAQVLCVTHLPQVAAQGNHHFYISKQTEDGKTRTQVTVLDKEGRIKELARMLGGLKITEKTLQHASEMLG